jgi:glutamyl-tRNA synthetase
MSVDEMTRLFSVDRISNAPAKFDRAKLLAFNTQTAERATPDRLVKVFRDYLAVNPDSPLNAATDEHLAQFLAMKKGFRTLREVDELCRFFYLPDDAVPMDPKAADKVLKKDNNAGAKVLRDIRDLLATANPWTSDALESAVKNYAESRSLGLGNVAQPIRVALSGATVSPPIFQCMEFLGKTRSLTRIDRVISSF